MKKKRFFLGIDQGTTGTTALLLDENWCLAARGYKEITQIYPHPGWVEHDANEIWVSVREAVSQTLKIADILPSDIVCIGIDHEGETAVLWDSATGVPVYNAIVWQDRRSAHFADSLKVQSGDLIYKKTGIMPDSYFSALKIKWVIDNVPKAQELMKSGRLLAGNMDAWIIWNMTKGRIYATDASTASRTMLYNLSTSSWDKEILALLGMDQITLPAIHDSAGVLGNSDPDAFINIKAPISGLLADQQAALLGQACIDPGMVKTTYGTGCFMLMNTGEKQISSQSGILTTIAWQINKKKYFAIDGGIYISGAATQWLRDGLRIITSAAETEQIAIQAKSNGGVYFVPAFTGLAAPVWDSYARGLIIGITGGTTREHLVRATLESAAYQVKDLMDAMEKGSGFSIGMMRCDGGASQNNFLMQFQSDILGIPLEIPDIIDTTAFGAAFIAAVGIGEYSDIRSISSKLGIRRRFEPSMSIEERDEYMYFWHKAIDRAKGWSESIS